MIRRLPTFDGYTIDARLREFRKASAEGLPEFIPFDSEQGSRLVVRLIMAGRADELFVESQRTPDGVEQVALRTDETGWVCPCGNTPADEGFYPCRPDGDQTEPLPDWGSLYVCQRCGRIFDRHTGVVIGRRENRAA